MARAWRALNRSWRSLALAAASEDDDEEEVDGVDVDGSVLVGFSGMGSDDVSADGSALGTVSSGCTSDDSAVARVFLFFAGGIFVLILDKPGFSQSKCICPSLCCSQSCCDFSNSLWDGI